MLYALLTRHAFDVNVIHDRNPVFVRMADGAIRNGYTMRILNKRLETRRFARVCGRPAGGGRRNRRIAAGCGARGGSRAGSVARISGAGQQLRIRTARLHADHLPYPRSRIARMGAGAGSFPCTGASTMKTETVTPKPAREVTGTTVLICFVGFFGVVATVNADHDARRDHDLCRHRDSSLLQAGLAYNRKKRRPRAQAALNWQVDGRIVRARVGRSGSDRRREGHETGPGLRHRYHCAARRIR